MGFAAIGLPVGEWIVEQQWWAGRRHQVMTAVQRWAAEHAIAAGMPLETLRQQAGLPASELVPKLKLGPHELAAAVRAGHLTRDELRERAARRVEELHLGRRWQPPTVVTGSICVARRRHIVRSARDR